MATLRQTDGLCGFTKRSESVYDCFGVSHSLTIILAGLAMAIRRDRKGRKNNVVAVIGDGATMTNNDNKQVPFPTSNLDGPIPPVGALSNMLSRLQSNHHSEN